MEPYFRYSGFAMFPNMRGNVFSEFNNPGCFENPTLSRIGY